MTAPMTTERATLVLAPNPGPMTLDGTNTWILAEPGASRAVVVDPGPLDEGHLAAVLAAVEARGCRVGLVLLTHRHADHAEGAARFAALAGNVEVRAPSEGEVVSVDDLEVRVVATPGHTSDSVCFVLPADRAVLTGDTVLGRGTTVVAWPDGILADYLASLARLRDLAASGVVSTVLPGHGPVLRDTALEAIDYYIAHRRERLAQVEAAVAAGDRTPAEIVERVYADVDRSLWPAAELSVRAQLEYLQRRLPNR